MDESSFSLPATRSRAVKHRGIWYRYRTARKWRKPMLWSVRYARNSPAESGQMTDEDVSARYARSATSELRTALRQ